MIIIKNDIEQVRIDYFRTTFLFKEKLKERELREQMEKQLQIKEQEMSEISKKQQELEMKFLQSNLNETEIKTENERLQKVYFRREANELFIDICLLICIQEKEFLEEQLSEIAKDLEESRIYIAQLQSQTKQEKRDRAK